MAKRHAEESLLLLHEFPSKTLPRSLLSVDLQLGGADPPAAAPRPASRSPPALLAGVGGGRCRKRPHSSEEPEQTPRHPGVCIREHAADGGVTVQTPGSVREHHGSGSPANHKKRPREDREASPPGALDKVAAGDSDTEDCAFNTFWFWRPPLPKLDLSLLEDDHSHPQTEERSKGKDRFSDAMET